MLKVFFTFPFLLLISCSSESEHVMERSVVNHSIEIAAKNTIGNGNEIIDEVVKIKLSEEISSKVGFVSFFSFLHDVGVLLVDKTAGVISLISLEGEMLWQLGASQNGGKSFNGIVNIYFDQFSRTIFVYDEAAVFQYNLKGEYLGKKHGPEVDFLNMAPVSNETVVFSAQGLPNPHVVPSPKQLFFYQNDSLISAKLNEINFAPKDVVIGGIMEFSWFNGVLGYHPVFRDTFYQIDFPIVFPAFTLYFKNIENTNEVMENGAVENKFQYIFNRSIPFVQNFAFNNKYLYVIYQYEGGRYLTCIDIVSGKSLVNNHFLKIDGGVYLIPTLYDNGYFMRIMPQYQIDYLSKIDPGAHNVDKNWKTDLQELDDAYDDRGEKIVCLFRLKDG